jgi:DNA-binding NarL/FixJ family response regulator
MRVLLVDDHRPVRQVMARLLGAEPDIEVIAETGTGRNALELARQLAPEIVLMNVRLPGMSGIDTARAILSELPNVCVIGMTLVDNPAEAEAIREAGARACISKSGPAEELLRVVREIHALQVSEQPGDATLARTRPRQGPA